ncbi:hypothetical protein [Kribbella sp. CA-294648]|uniref:hypothetical protein n=1 Tax=Kribbella sp. CA-294648 TaxID=3239948 RepID=UPI003D8D3FCD
MILVAGSWGWGDDRGYGGGGGAGGRVAGWIPADLIPAVAAEVPDHWDDFVNLYRKFTPRIMALLVYDELHVDEELTS